MARSRKFYDVAVREIQSHKDGFRDSGQKCSDCGHAIPLKYRGDEANPDSFSLNRCDKCFVSTADGYSLRYNYPPVWESGSLVAFYGAGMVCVAKFLLKIPMTHAIIIYCAGLIPGTLIVRYLSRWKTTPQHQAEWLLKEINTEDERIKKRIMYDRAEAAARERIRLRTISGIEDIDVMDGIMFEDRLQTLFTGMGYKVKRTPGSGDQGLDLILEKDERRIGVQAKRYSTDTAVGNAAVQEVLGGKVFYGCQEAWVVTNTRFTDSAWALAKKAGVRLIDRNRLIELLGQAADAGPAS